jgi:hypothetical protein
VRLGHEALAVEPARKIVKGARPSKGTRV